MNRLCVVLLCAFCATAAVPACSNGSTEAVAAKAIEPNLAPNTVNTKLGEDFIDGAGRLWKCTGKASFQNINPEGIFARLGSTDTGGPSAGPAASLTLSELAERIRPVRLVGEYEYRLAEPDTLVAKRILAMQAPPPTQGNNVGPPPPPPFELKSDIQPAAIIYDPNDTRWLYYPGYATAFGRISQDCTFTLIGPSTALSAAHCFYQCGAWINGGLLHLAAYNHGSSESSAVFPNGSSGWYADSLTIPGGWFNGAGSSNCGSQTPLSHSGWDDDYAVLEFAPTRYPGNWSGWMGTELLSIGTQWIVGYNVGYQANPPASAKWSQWAAQGTYSFLDGARYIHYMDVYGGESGACIYNLKDPLVCFLHYTHSHFHGTAARVDAAA